MTVGRTGLEHLAKTTGKTSDSKASGAESGASESDSGDPDPDLARLDHQLICGDVLEALRREVPLESVDLIFADPPYNIGVDYGFGPATDRQTTIGYGNWVMAWIMECAGHLTPSGSMWVLINESNADFVGYQMTRLVGPRRNRIIWRERFGQYQEGKFASGHRHLFYHTKHDRDFTWNPDPIREPSVRMKMGDKRAAGPRVPDDVWDVSRLQGNCKERVGWHPAQLRQEPIERIILATSNPGDTVLDPFIGSGTTLRACIATGRRCIGIDNNPDYISRLRR